MDDQLKQIQKLLDAAEGNLQSARNLLRNTLNGKTEPLDISNKATNLETNSTPDIVQGVFNGESMVADGDKTYPVPPNYASKSKLVEGDTLKLTIADDGSFIFKQIEPVERKSLVGTLAQSEGGYLVNADGKSYKVLTASVTFYKANIGGQVTVLVPKNHDAKWAAMENVIDSAVSTETTDSVKIEQPSTVVSENLPNQNDVAESVPVMTPDVTDAEPIEEPPITIPSQLSDLGEIVIQPVSTDSVSEIAPAIPDLETQVASIALPEISVPDQGVTNPVSTIPVPLVGDSLQTDTPNIEFPAGDSTLTDDQLLENLKNNLKNIETPDFVTPQQVVSSKTTDNIVADVLNSLPNKTPNATSDQSISELEI